MALPLISSDGLEVAQNFSQTKQQRNAGAESWLSRLFLLAVACAGLLTYILGLKPEDLALLPCPIHYVTGIECPGCGITRACIALARGDIGHALNSNPFSLGLVLLAGGFALFNALVVQRLSSPYQW